MGALIRRRSFLIGTLAAGASLALVGAVRLDAPEPGRRVLSASEAAIVAAAADALFPRGPIDVDPVAAGIVDTVDLYVADHMPSVHAAGFRYLLAALEWGPLASHGAPFTRLDRAGRTEVLQIWAEPGVLPRRVASDGLKAVLGAAYFRLPPVQAVMGWRATCGGGVS